MKKKILSIIAGLFLLLGSVTLMAGEKCKPYSIKVMGVPFNGPCVGEVWTEPADGTKWTNVGMLVKDEWNIRIIFWDHIGNDCVADIANIYQRGPGNIFTLVGPANIERILQQIKAEGDEHLIEWAPCEPHLRAKGI